MYRNTYAVVNTKNIKDNVSKVIEEYKNYEYYFGVVKADCYGHNNIDSIKSIIDGGVNYLAVATLDEALLIRDELKDIPILCLGIIPPKYVNVCIENNITMTISSLDYAKELVREKDLGNLKVHIKINTGMNRLGISDEVEVEDTYRLLKDKGIFIEGVYTHIYDAISSEHTLVQFDEYVRLIKNLPKEEIRIFHVAASDALVLYDKINFVNGCRLGIIMYGFSSKLKLKSTMEFVSEVVQINNLKKGDTTGYNAKYMASKDTKIAVVSCGYADGVIRKNTGRVVYINNKEYKIVGNICMDMLFVEVDDKVKVGDKVFILRDNDHIKYVSSYLETIPYEVLCSISKRVPRIYK